MPGSGNMLSFDGADDYAETNQTISFSSHTIEAWINPDALSFAGIVSIGSGKFSQMILTSAGYLGVDVLNSGGAVKTYTGTTESISTGEWYHVAYTFDSVADGLTLYVNGVQESLSISNDQDLTNFTLSAAPLYIGKDQNNTNFFTGMIDEVRVWNSVLSLSDIRENMCKKIDPVPGNLVAYYRFDQDFGTTLYDLSSSSNDCVVNGATWAQSGAPIGDESLYDYVGGDGFSVNLAHADGDNMTMTVTGSLPDGIHLYLVNQYPNTSVVDAGTVKTNRYWGSFIVGSTNGYAFSYDYGLNPYSNATPGDNSIAYRYGITDTNTWIKDFGSEDGGSGILQATAYSQRAEVILRDSN